MADYARFGVGRVTRFYVPLLLQAFSQSLTYPLVAGIVTCGALGVNALTAFSQGLMIMFMVGAIGGGLVTTGMVFARTRKGYAEFRRLNAVMMGFLLLLQCVPALPPFCGWVFEGFFALPPELAAIARRTLLSGVVMNGAFFLRNVPMVVLFNNLESGKANTATFLRILVSLACAAAFPRLRLSGPDWGLFALTLGVVVELAVTWAYARPFVRDLPGDAGGEHVSLLEQLRFTLPLSLGGFLLMLSPLAVAAFVGRSAQAADMLVVHYVSLGVANPVAYAALRMQAVAIKFPPECPGDRRLLLYALCSGAVLGLIPLLFATPLVGDWYCGSYQNVPDRLLPTVRLAIGIYSLICLIQVVRGRIEGLAALRKRPRAVMMGQIGYTATLAATLAILLPLGVPGWAMAVAAIFAAPVAATACVYAFLKPALPPKTPSPPSNPSNLSNPPLTDILWDWNGTLLDDTQAALDALNAMLSRRGLRPITMDFYRDHFGFPVRPFYARIGIDLAHEDWGALAREYHDAYARQPKRLNAGALAALECAKARGVRQCVVSALRQDLLDADLARFGVRDYLTFAYGTDNLDGSSKLTRARDLMARLGHPDPQGVVIIGDAFHDQEVADTLGIRCILHAQGSHAAWRLGKVAPVADTLEAAVKMSL